MTPTTSTEISTEAIQAFDDVNGGVHASFRPAHAKGVLLAGKFTPSSGGHLLTFAPHIRRESTPVTIRFSNFAGIPTIPDNHPEASPRGMAIRFHLAEHVHTDIVAHSVNGFPARTAEEFVEFLRAIHDGSIGAYLAAHPAALAFVQAPKPFPVSFAKESYFAVNAYRFQSEGGEIRHGRYRIVPEGGVEYTDGADKPANYLFEEITGRLAKGPAQMRIQVQVAAAGDIVDDSTLQWPDDRPLVEFGTIEIQSVVPDNASAQQHIIFDPIPRVVGIEPSQDPLLAPRADVYLASGRRRRSAK